MTVAQWANNLGIWWYIIFYFAVQLINVVFNTLKTIITSRATKIPAAIINALTFGFYTLVVYLTAGAGNVWVNMAITVVANLIGVYFSIMVLEKLRKDKLWEITATTTDCMNADEIGKDLKLYDISYNMLKVYSKHNAYVFHIYCPTQKESEIVRKIFKQHGNVKYIVHEENAKL